MKAVPLPLPRRHRIVTTAACVALLAACGTSTTPSGTTASSGCSVGSTETPNRCWPATVRADRGGRKVIVAVVVVPGYNDTAGGSIAAHSPGTPITDSS